VDLQRKHLKAWTHFSGSKHEYSRWLNKLVKYLRLPIPFPDFLGSEDSHYILMAPRPTSTNPVEPLGQPQPTSADLGPSWPRRHQNVVSVQPSRGVLETMTIPHSIPMDLAVSRPHDVFEQLPIAADLDFSAHFFPRPDQNSGYSISAALGAGDQEFNMIIDTGYS
jgi:hypothetical protein